MTGKDWLLLLVPILCNGILLYLFSKRIMSQTEAKTGQRNLQQAARSELRVMVQSALSKCSTMLTQKQNVFEDDVDELAGLIHRITDWVEMQAGILAGCRPALKQVVLAMLVLDEQCASEPEDGVYRADQIPGLKATLGQIQEALKVLYKQCQGAEA